MNFAEWANQFDRIAIVGGPKQGKTTISEEVKDRHVLHTDDYLESDWSGVPARIVNDLARHDRFVVEGIQVARALRKGLEVDVIVDMRLPVGVYVPMKEGHHRMVKAVSTWMKDVPTNIPRVKIEEILEQ